MAQAKGMEAQVLGGVKEATYNTHPNVGNGTTIKLPVIYPVTLNATRNLIKSNVIRGRRDAYKPYQGNMDLNGTLNVPLDLINIGYWLQMMLGDPVTTGNSAPYTHTWQVPDSLDSWVIELGYTDIVQYFRYNGIKASSLGFNFGGDGEMQVSVGLVGSGSELIAATSMDGGTPTSQAFTPFYFSHAAIKEGGSTVATVSSCNFTIDNGLGTGAENYLIGGSGARGILTEGECLVTGTLSAVFESETLYEKAVNGTESSIQITLTNGSYSLDLLMGELMYDKQQPGVPGPAGIFVEMPFQAYFDNASPDKTAFQAILVNTLSAYIA